MAPEVNGNEYEVEPKKRTFYRSVLDLLNDGGVDYLIGGAFAFHRHTGIWRKTKDFDLFIRREDYPLITSMLEAAGLHTELKFPHWLGKAFKGDDFIDLIYSGGNGIATVDDIWFENSQPTALFGVPVRMSPIEEMIWSKAFIMERERFDGADVAHLILCCGESLDWERLIWRFGEHWRVLFAHLTLFQFVYPSERSKIPVWVLQDLVSRFRRESVDEDDKVCHGPLISRAQYLVDVDYLGFEDARLEPRGNMSERDIQHWTAAIDD